MEDSNGALSRSAHGRVTAPEAPRVPAQREKHQNKIQSTATDTYNLRSEAVRCIHRCSPSN